MKVIADYFYDFNVSSSYKRSNETNMCRKDARRADEALCVCPKCKTVWEVDISTSQARQLKKQGTPHIFYYSHFPRYGKPEKVCYWCTVGKHRLK